MKMKLIAGSAFLLNTVLFATYYAVTKEALSRIDPIIFTFFEMVSLAPAGLLIVLCSWKQLTRAVVKRGIVLGSVLCLALFTIAIALKYTTATSTAFFPALNGFVAALIAWALFREPLKGATWLAGVLSLAGAALLILTSSMGNVRGTLIAFLGGLFYTGYIFLCDHEQKDEQAQWPLFGIELLTTALWANLVALLFGDWQAVHAVLPKDIWVVLYVSVVCTFIPTLITVLLQKYISPVTVSFIYILEPVLGAVVANLYLGEVLPVQGYLGGALVVLGALINTWGTVGPPAEKSAQKPSGARAARRSWASSLLYPGVGCLSGAFLLFRLGGIPPASWNELARVWPQVSQYLQHGQRDYVTLLLIQSGGWLIAWISVLLMGVLTLFNLLRLLFQPAASSQVARQKVHHSARAVALASPIAARPSIQPVRRVRTSAVLPEQYTPRPRAAEELPAQQRPRPRTTERLPGPSAPRPRMTTRPLVQPTPRSRQSEQPTWYGQAVWPAASDTGLRDTPVPSTEPLRAEPGPGAMSGVEVETEASSASLHRGAASELPRPAHRAGPIW